MSKKTNENELETIVCKLTTEVEKLVDEVEHLKAKTEDSKDRPEKDSERRIPYIAHQSNDSVYRFIRTKGDW